MEQGSGQRAEPWKDGVYFMWAEQVRRTMRDLDDVTGNVIDAAIRIHRTLGPGLLETVYEAILTKELERRGLVVYRQMVVPFEYDGIHFDERLRVDLLVDGRVVVELKSVERVAPVHGKQLLTYLRLSKLPVGLLINFGGATLKEGIQRIVNELPPASSPRLRVNRVVHSPDA